MLASKHPHGSSLSDGLAGPTVGSTDHEFTPDKQRPEPREKRTGDVQWRPDTGHGIWTAIGDGHGRCPQTEHSCPWIVRSPCNGVPCCRVVVGSVGSLAEVSQTGPRDLPRHRSQRSRDLCEDVRPVPVPSEQRAYRSPDRATASAAQRAHLTPRVRQMQGDTDLAMR